MMNRSRGTKQSLHNDSSGLKNTSPRDAATFNCIGLFGCRITSFTTQSQQEDLAEMSVVISTDRGFIGSC
ncbi:hypothetical protein Q1695_000135 [Nippostrongylus brasiliensis]|nr:hypothetical protein Q1695_000135 [Nippostrongylus brasiliensis]